MATLRACRAHLTDVFGELPPEHLDVEFLLGPGEHEVEELSESLAERLFIAALDVARNKYSSSNKVCLSAGPSARALASHFPYAVLNCDRCCAITHRD